MVYDGLLWAAHRVLHWLYLTVIGICKGPFLHLLSLFVMRFLCFDWPMLAVYVQYYIQASSVINYLN